MLVNGKVRADLTAESAVSVLVETLNDAESINQSINQSISCVIARYPFSVSLLSYTHIYMTGNPANNNSFTTFCETRVVTDDFIY